jgi:predicted dithiol-disulfide oxidoreductase (DUF899 family)
LSLPGRPSRLDIVIGASNFLDLVPKGRDEDGLPFASRRRFE